MRAALTHENAARRHNRARVLLYAEALGLAVTAVARAAHALLMREKLQIKLKHGSHLSLYEIFTASGSIFSISSNPSRIVSNTASVKSSGASLSFRKKSPLATR